MMNQNSSGAYTAAAPAQSGILSKTTRILYAAFVGMFAYTTLPVLLVTFLLLSVALPTVSVLNLLAITRIPFQVLTIPIVGVPQLIVSILVGTIFLALGVGCFFALRGVGRHLKSLF